MIYRELITFGWVQKPSSRIIVNSYSCILPQNRLIRERKIVLFTQNNFLIELLRRLCLKMIFVAIFSLVLTDFASIHRTREPPKVRTHH